MSIRSILTTGCDDEANAGIANLDPALMNFLEKYFPLEVKVKQKENERSIGVDRYGKAYSRCSLM